MILPSKASWVPNMVAIANVPPALLYAEMWNLSVYQAKAVEIQVPSTVQLPNSWWVEGHGACLAGYATRPLSDIILEAEEFFPPDLVCNCIFIPFMAKPVARSPPSKWLGYLT